MNHFDVIQIKYMTKYTNSVYKPDDVYCCKR